MFFMSIYLIMVLGFPLSAQAQQSVIVDSLLAETAIYLKTAPEKISIPLEKLQKLESSFDAEQKEKYYLLLASSLAFRGEYRKVADLIKSRISQVKVPDARADLLYLLSMAYTNLGEYEAAIVAMNEGVILLPKLTKPESKVRTLDAAISLFNSLHSYDEAMRYAVRMYGVDPDDKPGVGRCLSLTNQTEINFFKGDSQNGRALLGEAVDVCDKQGRKMISLISKTYNAIDLINTGESDLGIKSGLLLLNEFVNASPTVKYRTELEEAIARGYLKKGNLVLADRYGSQAYERAKFQNLLQLQEKTSETMAKIKRALGQSDSAMDYFEINLALKKKVLDDQLQKNLAYQRVKFDTQDKANQLVLAEQKNKTLEVEKTLQQGKNQNLLLLITLSLVLLTIVGGWLLRTLRQKNIFKVSSQIDGLTQISNRTFFIESAKQAFKNPANSVTLILFDMDHFKSINDTFGHSTGDWVLRTVCNVVKSQLRPTDLFGRLGGEEFAICLTNLSEPGVLALAERCRAGVAAIDTKPSGSQFLISASFGLATHGVRGNTSFEDILAAADKALYFSKNGGRNLVSVFQ